MADVLLGYGERHFDGAPGQKGARRGVWAGVLLMCGQFERVSALVARLILVSNSDVWHRLSPRCGTTARRKWKPYIWPLLSPTMVCSACPYEQRRRTSRRVSRVASILDMC